MHAQPSTFRTQCCQQMVVAAAQADRPTMFVMVKPPDRKRRTPYYTVTLSDASGRLLASCRHEFGPFDGTDIADRIARLVASAFD